MAVRGDSLFRFICIIHYVLRLEFVLVAILLPSVRIGGNVFNNHKKNNHFRILACEGRDAFTVLMSPVKDETMYNHGLRF